ncbi:MAG TPA: hypothetical protein VHI52_21040 [Verrucomicrobiae bacterium]|nr:hypothetical protein [Verrucomicrobiae bacterium]
MSTIEITYKTNAGFQGERERRKLPPLVVFPVPTGKPILQVQ